MRTICIVLAALVAFGTLTAAQQISCDYSRADFTHFKTYAWASGHPVTDELLNRSIVNSIENQLSAKGLTRVGPEAHPNVLVSYDVVFDRDVRGLGLSDGLRSLHWRSGSKYVLTGMLVVNLVNADTGDMVWRGMASGDVDTKASPGKRDKKIREIALRLFRNYPPEK